MNLNQLRIFHHAARTESFTRAADELYLTQPGVSKHIRHLEDHLGVRLFDRLGKQVRLTQAGEILFETTQAVFRRIDAVKRKLDDLKGLRGGKLKIAASITFGVYVLPEVLGRFTLEYPDIKLSTDLCLSRRVEEKVLANQNDIGIVGHPTRDDRLATERLLSDELVVIVPPGHVWSKRKYIKPRHLMDHPLIVARIGSGTREAVEEILKNNGLVLKSKMAFGNTEGVKKAVEAGLGISIVSKNVVKREVSQDLLVALPLSGIPTKRDFNLIYLKDKYLGAPVRAFVEFLKNDK